MQFFEWYLDGGVLWNKLSSEAAELVKNGISAIWIPPAYKGSQGAQDVGYGTYDIWDLGEFDQKGTVATKYGTKQELRDAIRSAHHAGLQIYADVVLDHMMGADGTEQVSAMEVEKQDRLQDAEPASRTIRAWTVFNFPGRAGKYSDFRWNCQHFNGVDWDADAQKSAIYLFDGKNWDENVDCENGNFDYLMGADIDLSHPEVVDELTKWGTWFVQELDLDGFRFDAVKHMTTKFFDQWIGRVRERVGKELFSVGEYWNGDLETLLGYLEATGGQFSLFDVPLHYRLHEAATSNGAFDMRTVFDRTLTQSRPDHAVTFVDNHDTQPGQALESYVPEWFKPQAYALILLREGGYPCVFYGDYYGIAQPQQIAPQKKMLDTLMDVRSNRAYGPQHDYFDDASVVGWTREGDDEHKNSGVAVLLTNERGGAKKMYVGRQHAGKRMEQVHGGEDAVIIVGEDGMATFEVPDGSMRVWVLADEQ